MPQETTASTAETDAIRRAQAGDTEAFGDLYKAHYGQIYRTVHGMMGNAADCEDACQKVWLKAWQKLEHFNFQSNFTTWLHRIAVNTSLDELRRRKRYWSRFKSAFVSNETGTAEVIIDVDNHERPYAELLKAENAERIHRAIAKLPEAQRTVLVLKEFEDYTYEQIASTVDCKIGTVMSRLHLARKKLISTLNPHSS